MNTKEEHFWQNLLAHSEPAFVGETAPPYGFTTRVLAQVREENRQQAQLERIGFRAIFAALAMVALTAALTVGLQFGDREDSDPAVKSMALVENLQVS